jgi:hypothetical protein
MMHLPRSGAAVELRSGRNRNTYEIPDVPIIDDDVMTEFIRREARRWYGWLVLGEQPPVVAAKMKWLCENYCSFNGEIIEGGPCHPNKERETGNEYVAGALAL